MTVSEPLQSTYPPSGQPDRSMFLRINGKDAVLSEDGAMIVHVYCL